MPTPTQRILVLLLWAAAGLPVTVAQVVLTTDDGLRQERLQATPVSQPRSGAPDTIVLAPGQAFFDDFSANFGTQPDSSRWYIPEIDFRAATVARGIASSAPTPGVLRFDGLRRSNIPYETLISARGPADRLVSHFLDLSGLGPGNEYWLYIYLEAGGLGEPPEAIDSFFVNLITPSDTFAVARLGGDVPNGRTWVAVPLDQSGYFTPLTQLVLESDGSLNGMLDLWLVDYLWLGPEIAGGPDNLNEQGPYRLLSSPLEPFFSYPWKYYREGNNRHRTYQVTVRQADQSAYSGDLVSSFADSAGQATPVIPFSATVPVSIAANGLQPADVPAFARQAAAAPGPWYATHFLANHQDRFRGNDTLRVRIGIDSVLAYDDGSAEASFGLNRSLSFGLEFTLPRRDTVEAVWMYFVPTVHVNGTTGKLTYLDEKVFRLRLWDSPHPDSFFVEQVADMEVRYEDEGQFVRLPLNQPAEVPTRFWVGLQQLDDVPIGLGYDLTYDRDALAYIDSAGNWVNTRSNGTPMIRLELSSGLPPVADLTGQLTISPPTLFPQPASSLEPLVVAFPQAVNRYRMSLLDLQGRVLWRSPEQRGTRFLVDLPGNLPDGLYVCRHEWRSNVQTFTWTDRFLIQN